MSYLSELMEHIQELHIAERTLDVEKLSSLIADDYAGIGENGEQGDKNTLLMQFKDISLEFEQHEVKNVEYRIYGEVGIVSGKVSLKGNYSDGQFQGKYVFTDICVRRDGQWQVVFSQMTVIVSP